MALKVERKGQLNTSENLPPRKPLLCYTCGLRKPGLFTTDVYMQPQCADCAAKQGHPIP